MPLTHSNHVLDGVVQLLLRPGHRVVRLHARHLDRGAAREGDGLEAPLHEHGAQVGVPLDLHAHRALEQLFVLGFLGV